MFRQIMVPLDGSERAEGALPYAEFLARTAGATVHLVSVIELPPAVKTQGVGAPVNVYEQIIAQQREEAVAYLERTQAQFAANGVPAQVALVEGDEASALLEYARQRGIDLAIMTTHGRTGLKRWALGSVADRVAHGGVLPVLLVPDTETALQAQTVEAGQILQFAARPSVDSDSL